MKISSVTPGCYRAPLVAGLRQMHRSALAEHDPKSGTESHVFGSEAARHDFLRSIMQTETEGYSEEDRHVVEMRQHLAAGEISEAWDIYEERIKDPLATYDLECTEVEIPGSITHYTRMKAGRSRCGKCNCQPTLLCPDEDSLPTMAPSFYICWTCQRINQVAVGEVREE